MRPYTLPFSSLGRHDVAEVGGKNSSLGEMISNLAKLGVSVMQTWAVEPALRAGIVRAVPITAGGIRRQWSAVTLKAAGRVPHVEAFVDLLAVRAMPARSPGRPVRRRTRR